MHFNNTGDHQLGHICVVSIQVYSEDKESLTVRLVEGSQPLKFIVNKAEEMVKAIGTVISRWQNQQPVSTLIFVYHTVLRGTFHSMVTTFGSFWSHNTNVTALKPTEIFVNGFVQFFHMSSEGALGNSLY